MTQPVKIPESSLQSFIFARTKRSLTNSIAGEASHTSGNMVGEHWLPMKAPPRTARFLESLDPSNWLPPEVPVPPHTSLNHSLQVVRPLTGCLLDNLASPPECELSLRLLNAFSLQLKVRLHL